MLSSFLRSCQLLFTRPGLKRPRIATYRPQMEQLEDRLSPARFTVTTIADSVAGIISAGRFRQRQGAPLSTGNGPGAVGLAGTRPKRGNGELLLAGN